MVIEIHKEEIMATMIGIAILGSSRSLSILGVLSGFSTQTAGLGRSRNGKTALAFGH